jgi:AbrB family looped-hinge helix DNA binding protein
MNFDMKRVDEKGRVVITKTLRELCGFKEGTVVALYVRGDKIVIEPFTKFIEGQSYKKQIEE